MAATTAASHAHSTPERSLEQRMAALGKANHVRTWRAHAKQDIKYGRMSAQTLISETPDEADTMKVLDLLLAAPKIGRVKAMKMLTHAHISPSKTLGGLSARQRIELLSFLGSR